MNINNHIRTFNPNLSESGSADPVGSASHGGLLPVAENHPEPTLVAIAVEPPAEFPAPKPGGLKRRQAFRRFESEASLEKKKPLGAVSIEIPQDAPFAARERKQTKKEPPLKKSVGLVLREELGESSIALTGRKTKKSRSVKNLYALASISLSTDNMPEKSEKPEKPKKPPSFFSPKRRLQKPAIFNQGGVEFDAKYKKEVRELIKSQVFQAIENIDIERENAGEFKPKAFLSAATSALNDHKAWTYASKYNLTLTELTVIRLYKKQAYNDINCTLRPFNPDYHPAEPISGELLVQVCAAIDSGLAKLPVLEFDEEGKFVVYRGMRTWPKDIKAGDTLVDPAYISTSADLKVVENSFDGKFRVKLVLTPDMNAKNIEPLLTSGKNEAEILVPRDVAFRVKSMDNALSIPYWGGDPQPVVQVELLPS